MIKVPWKIDDPDYPDYLQKEFVAYVFQFCGPLTREGVDNLADAYREVWRIIKNHDAKTRKRLELLRMMKLIKERKIEKEKSVLQEQIQRLNSL